MVLRERDIYWETVVENIAEGLMLVDPQGVITYVNHALEELTGYQRVELVGRPCSTLQCNACQGLRPWNPHKQCDLFRLGCFQRVRCSLIRKDGKPLSFLKNACIIRNAQGQVIGGVETFTDLTEVLARDQVISHLRQELSRDEGFFGLIGQSPGMLRLFELITSAAAGEAPVIIYGESGTGKELVAGAIHRLSPRAGGPFIKVNSAALNESLLESELFGHVKGAFTGADRTRIGRFEAAHGGSIFLDEIGDLPLSTQAKLLRVLQEKVIEKVGDHRPIPVDVRIITATNQDLQRLMAEGRFRDDLYFRINVIPVVLPPLRDRRQDIPLLVEHFLTKGLAKARKAITGVSPEAMELLLDYSWPGNVRELINVIDYAMVLCPEGLIQPRHLPAQIFGKAESNGRPRGRQGGPRPTVSREALVEALRSAHGKRAEAARLLGVSRVTLWKWLKEHQVQVETVIRD
jgi:two-component system response regulator HydG